MRSYYSALSSWVRWWQTILASAAQPHGEQHHCVLTSLPLLWEATLPLLAGMYSDMFKISRARGDRLPHSPFLTHWGQPVSLAADKTASLTTPLSRSVKLLANPQTVWWNDWDSSLPSTLLSPLNNQHAWGYGIITQQPYLKRHSWCQTVFTHSSVLIDSLQLRSSELSPQSSSPSQLHLSGMQRWLSQRKSPLGLQVNSSRGRVGAWNMMASVTNLCHYPYHTNNKH